MTQSTTISPGSVVAARELNTVSGTAVLVPDPQHVIHLQFRRFAGCPICNMHLQSVLRRHDEIEAAGIREVVVFHSTDEELRRHVSDLPVAVVGDPEKRLYAEFGVESSPSAVLNPRAVAPVFRGMVAQRRLLPTITGDRADARPPNLHPTGGRLGLPADFLIGSDGLVIACKYGTHADDQWSVDELLAQLR
ncbi:AhpC/TSA family protein [Mycobacterium szulgai]|uniref:Alkyl hydroperoxide reductase n=1 Tax=Mycobacterium szulgai TaxID=1787 RepID=A0A1X2DIZ5_MYCSZ|nr:AhpC/TSA family protein [Mycobacterium szulgai]MCV7074636.1 redoxin domain-containing protein [Mycobacterium szulgai]ORW87984.1 alkyl hydroperoxide reductase [Mycobacterium szulgai]